MQSLSNAFASSPLVTCCYGRVHALQRRSDRLWAASLTGRHLSTNEPAAGVDSLSGQSIVLALGGTPIAAPGALRPNTW